MNWIKTNYLKALIILPFIIQCMRQDLKIFSFDYINDFQKVSYKEVSYNNFSELYNNINLVNETDDTSEVKKIQIKLSPSMEIYHYCNNYLMLKDSPIYFESIRFYDSIVSIDKMIKNNVNKIKIENTRIVFNKSIFHFKIGNKEYVLLGASDREFYRNIERNYWILLEVKGKNIKNIYSFIDGYSENPKCFGDFNDDGELDYLNWYFNKNKIELYTLSKNEFLLQKKEYIYVVPTIEEREMLRRGKFVTFSILDKKKSKWTNFQQ